MEQEQNILPQPSSEIKNQTTRAQVIAWVLVALWAVFIFFMSAHTSSGLDQDMGFFSAIYQQLKLVQENLFGPGVDVLSPIAHFLEYTLFGILLANALRFTMTLRKACFFAILFASAYGITDEFHQYFVPERMCDPVDWLVDTLGASIGSAFAYLVLRKRNTLS